nr:fumarylacetoacetase [Candidatus Eremiobacteraeota bacterium]
MTAQANVDSGLQSWVEVDPGSDFPIQNLPYGVFLRDGSAHIGVAIGRQILDLHVLAGTGLLDGVCERGMLVSPTLNALLAAGRPVWSALRARLTDLLRVGNEEIARTANSEELLVEQSGAQMQLPFQIGDYVDFYSSLEHATNLGKIFRPDGEALMPNWRHLPIGYHGRSSTIVIDGTPIVRPSGQSKPPSAATPTFGPSKL